MAIEAARNYATQYSLEDIRHLWDELKEAKTDAERIDVFYGPIPDKLEDIEKLVSYSTLKNTG